MGQLRDQIIFADGTVFDVAKTPEQSVHRMKRGREWQRLHIVATVEAAKAAFVAEADYWREMESVQQQRDPETGVVTEQIVTYPTPLSAYSIPGDVADMRDGTVIVYMGMPTETERLQEQLDAAAAAMAEGVNSIDQ